MRAIEAVRDAALERLPRLLVRAPDAVTIVLMDAPDAGDADATDSAQRHAIEVFEGEVMLARGTAILGVLPDPAIAIGSWLVLGDRDPSVAGGAAIGMAHAHDLLHATIDEAAALGELAGPGELMVPFDVSGIVDLRDPRFSVQSPDRGALVPWSCRLIRRPDHAVSIRTLTLADAPACDAIIAGLPDWFGVEQGIADCAAAVRSHDGLAAEIGGTVAGFLTWERRGTEAEITWMAVAAVRRHQGVGRALIGALVETLRADEIDELHVKTLSSRADHAPYAETRAFYLAMGFTAARELDIWGPENPALLLIRRL